MPKTKVKDLITNQEMAFARLAASSLAADAPPAPAPAVDPNQPTWADRIHPSEIMPLEAYPTAFDSAQPPGSPSR